MPKIRINRFELADVNRAVQTLGDNIDRALERFEQLRSGLLPFTGDIDLGGFRATNAGTSESNDDLLTNVELLDRMDEIEEEASEFETSSAPDYGGGGRQKRLTRRTSRLKDFALDAAAQAGEDGANAALNAHIDNYSEELSGGEPTVTFTLSKTPNAGTEILHYNGTRLRRVAVGPRFGEYTITGSVVTLGFSKDTGDFLVADYRGQAGSQRVFHEELTGTGTMFTLADAPDIDTEVVFYNTLRLLRTAGAPAFGQYSIATDVITLGFTKDVGDFLVVDYDVTDPLVDHNHVYSEELTGTGTSFSLVELQISGSEILWYNEVRLKRVGATPGFGEYTIVANTVTLGFTKDAGDILVADYTVET